jgi:hypothetical protein
MVKEIQPRCFPPNLIHEQKLYAETLERYVSYTRGGCADALSCDRQRLRSSPSTVLLRGPADVTSACWLQRGTWRFHSQQRLRPQRHEKPLLMPATPLMSTL